MSASTDQLRQDHVFILSVLDGMDSVVDSIRIGELVHVDVFRSFITFCRGFVDRVHHYREEKCLFPTLNTFGLSSEYGPIAVMLHEHELGRELLRELQCVLDTGFHELNERYQAADICEQFSRHLRQHIFKEDNILFRMADQLIDLPGESLTHHCFEALRPSDVELSEAELRKIGIELATMRVMA